ncbi:MAG: hypothetical protein Q9228_001574 [Teloschistes exilis]
MAASPASTSSSSDLYATSEVREERDSVQPTWGDTPLGLAATPAPEILSAVTDEHPGVSLALGHDESYTDHGNTMEGYMERPTNALAKRKREEDPEMLYVTGTRSGSPTLISSTRNTATDGHAKLDSQSRMSPEACSGPKRTRIGGHAAEKVGSVDAQARSATLPPELWHHVFRYVPPVFLGRLLRVDHAFHSYLTPGQTGDKPMVGSPSRWGAVQPLDAETIWAASRKRFAPGLPKPLRGLKELDMWRLLRGRICQLCDQTKESGQLSSTGKPWESGPGEHNVREVDLLLSSDCPSFLLPALPFAFVTSSLNYVPASLIREAKEALPATQIVKRFYKPHVQNIKKQLEEVRELGTASADEWTKGLAGEGREKVDDAIRWEKWESKGGLRKVNTRPQVKAIPASTTSSVPSSLPKRPNPPNWEGLDARGGPLMMNNNLYSNGSVMPSETSQYSHGAIPPYQVPWINTGPFQETAAYRMPPSLPSLPSARPERSIKDVNEAKAARRAEIERRCSLFSPPVLPNILSHMESFQAAIQISTPLTDAAWDVLKPRLLSQRASAEKREQEQVQQNELLQSESKQRRHLESQSKDVSDRHWDSIQAPIRDRLGVLADAVIDERWSNGIAVSKELSPRFAADVLLCVRQRFYEAVAREQEAATIPGDRNSSKTLTLSLENMKWVFDTKIKPFTEQFQKELFLCNGCDDNHKFYGFEGVIQHYAAKHTTALSMGSIVVYWRSEWPEEPPFNPQPSTSKSAYYKIPSPAAAGQNPYNHLDQQQFTPGSHYGAPPEAGPMQIASGTSSAQPLTSYYNAQTAPPQSAAYPLGYSQAYSSTQTPGVIPNGVPNGAAQPLPNGSIQQWPGYAASAAPIQGAPGQDYGQPYSGNHYPSTFSPNGAAPGGSYGPQVSQQAAPARPPHFDPSRNNAAQLTEEYQQQMNEMAKQARDVWFSTSSIKEILASVRIHVVIHHMAARFSEKFATVPSLAMFLDGLDNNAQMRPVRSLNGLACKTCVKQHNATMGANEHAQPPLGDRRLYTLPLLLNHFRTAHLEGCEAFANPGSGPTGPKHDWTGDMIELPEDRLVANLVHSAGMDDIKLELIAWAFPRVFPSPLPKLAVLRSQGQNLGSGKYFNLTNYPSMGSDPGLMTALGLSNRAGDESYGQSLNASRPISRVSGISEPPGEDEYDPHKPSYHSKNGVAGVGIEARNDIFTVPSDHTREAYEHGKPFYDRRVPESADLAKLLSNVTNMQPAPERKKLANHEGDHQPNVQGKSFVPEDYDPEAPTRYEHASLHDVHDKPHWARDNGYRNGRVSSHQMVEDGATPYPRYQAPSSAAGIGGGARTADQFLQQLGQESELADYHWAKGVERRSPVGPWSGVPSVSDEENSRQHQVELSRAIGYSVRQATPGLKLDNSIHPASRNGQNTSPTNNHTNYQRSASNALVHVTDPAINGRRSHTYVDYPTVQRTIVQASDDYSDERPDSGGAYRTAQGYYPRQRSRSPIPIAVDPRYYQHGSPLEDEASQPIYRIRSPLPQQETQVPRSFYERPSHERYEMVEDRNYIPTAQHQYRPRVEYVPVRVEERSPPDAGRYSVAHPTDPRGRVEYVRLPEGYNQGTLFERDGRLYRTESRMYPTPPSRGNAGSTVEYTY